MVTAKLDVVRKLLAKADRAATPEEAQTYTAKAVELMARHGIDAALLAAAEPGLDEIGAQQVPMDDPYSAGKARLLAWVASALRCRAVLHEPVRFGSGGGKAAAVTVFGFASDRERVELLYTSLLLQAGTQLPRQRPARRGESVAAYRRSWLHGYAVQVHRRLVEAENGAAAERSRAERSGDRPEGSRSVALVLSDRADRVDRAYAEAFPGVGRARRATLSGSGFTAGTAAGARADLGRGAVGGGSGAGLARQTRGGKIRGARVSVGAGTSSSAGAGPVPARPGATDTVIQSSEHHRPHAARDLPLPAGERLHGRSGQAVVVLAEPPQDLDSPAPPTTG